MFWGEIIISKVFSNMIYPVVLCGGKGTRLWPKSRAVMPKQFVPMISNDSLFQLTCRRVIGKNFNELTIFTSNDYRFAVAQQLSDISITKANIFLEPEPKNTAPSVILSCQYLYSKDPTAIVLVLPSDHYISCNRSFISMINEGLTLVEQGQIVTFGVKPTRVETGYGHIEIEKDYKVIGFHEKPDFSSAEKMLLTNNFVWNSGIFLMRAQDIMLSAQNLQPEMSKITSVSLKESEKDLDFIRIRNDPWCGLESKSIDKAIIEKISNLSCVPFKGDWSDLGDWLSVKNIQGSSDPDGNVLIGSATQINVKNSMIESMENGPTIGVVGLENVAVIADRDAVLVTHLSKSQMIGDLVEIMKTKGIFEATGHFRDFRPWGWFEVLFESENYKVKRLCVFPKRKLSLQSHKFRSEHWVVTEGEALVTVNENITNLKRGESKYIPKNSKHRLTNVTDKLLIVVEVQTGSYLGEDDIKRYDDEYNRVHPDHER